MVSLEGLTKVVDPSQLTADFDGSLEYNHEEWIEVRPTHLTSPETPRLPPNGVQIH